VLEIALQNGSATMNLVEAQLYGGSGTARIAIDRSGGRPAISQILEMTGIQAEPLLIAATGFDKLSGTGDITLDVTTTGTSQRQFVTNLMGDGSFIFRDGAFKGANLAEMARNVSLDALDSAVSSDQKTDFAELSATFTITDGVVRNDDLFMAAPLLRLTGKGNVNLPPRTLDYSVALRPVASLEGQGADAESAGGGIPILVRGPWSDPSIEPDLEAIAKGLMENPEAVQETLEGLGIESDVLDNLGGGEGGEGGNLLDSLGGDAEGAADAIKGLFD
jgi:AsmA protein